MNKGETAELLAMVAAFDRRTVGAADVEAWHSILGLYRAGDTVAALKQFKHDEPGIWVEPGHLAQIIDEWQRQWLWRVGAGKPMPIGGREADEDLVIVTEHGPVPLLEHKRQQAARQLEAGE